MLINYQKRLNILVNPPADNQMEFKTLLKGLVVAKGYSRVVIGKRGPYIEFDSSHINPKALFTPDEEMYRLSDKYKDVVCYAEYRTRDECYVKVYHQYRTVDYADYKIGAWYISPFLLTTDTVPNLIDLLVKTND